MSKIIGPGVSWRRMLGVTGSVGLLALSIYSAARAQPVEVNICTGLPFVGIGEQTSDLLVTVQSLPESSHTAVVCNENPSLQEIAKNYKIKNDDYSANVRKYNRIIKRRNLISRELRTTIVAQYDADIEQAQQWFLKHKEIGIPKFTDEVSRLDFESGGHFDFIDFNQLKSIDSYTKLMRKHEQEELQPRKADYPDSPVLEPMLYESTDKCDEPAHYLLVPSERINQGDEIIARLLFLAQSGRVFLPKNEVELKLRTTQQADVAGFVTLAQATLQEKAFRQAPKNANERSSFRARTSVDAKMLVFTKALAPAEKRLAICDTQVVGIEHGPPTGCFLIGVISQGRNWLRADWPPPFWIREFGCADSLFLSAAGGIYITFSLEELNSRKQVDLKSISKSMLVLTTELGLTSSYDEGKDTSGQVREVDITSSSGPRDSRLLGSPWRDSSDLNIQAELSDEKTGAKANIRAFFKPSICYWASGDLTTYAVPTSSQLAEYGKKLEGKLSMRLLASCPAGGNSIGDKIICN